MGLLSLIIYDSLTNFTLGFTTLAVTDVVSSAGFSVVPSVASYMGSLLISSCSVGTPPIFVPQGLLYILDCMNLL